MHIVERIVVDSFINLFHYFMYATTKLIERIRKICNCIYENIYIENGQLMIGFRLYVKLQINLWSNLYKNHWSFCQFERGCFFGIWLTRYEHFFPPHLPIVVIVIHYSTHSNNIFAAIQNLLFERKWPKMARIRYIISRDVITTITLLQRQEYAEWESRRKKKKRQRNKFIRQNLFRSTCHFMRMRTFCSGRIEFFFGTQTDTHIYTQHNGQKQNLAKASTQAIVAYQCIFQQFRNDDSSTAVCCWLSCCRFWFCCFFLQVFVLFILSFRFSFLLVYCHLCIGSLKILILDLVELLDSSFQAIYLYILFYICLCYLHITYTNILLCIHL